MVAVDDGARLLHSRSGVSGMNGERGLLFPICQSKSQILRVIGFSEEMRRPGHR
jgi:hypothetical protein